MSLLATLRAEFEAVELYTVDVAGDDRAFASLCPVDRQYVVVRVPGEQYKDVSVECKGGCSISRVADALHFMRQRGEWEPKPAQQREASTRLRVLDTLAMLTTEPPPLDWLADGVFCRGKLTLVGGREKRGKSLVQLVLAARMAAGGGDVAGIKVKAGKVLIVDAENGEREDHRRIRAVSLEPGHAENLTFAEARGFDLREHLADITQLLDHHRPDLLLVDSFRALWRGDERDEADVAAALDPLRDLAHDRDIAVGLTHHAQKGGDEYRGSTAIGASIEWCVMLDRRPEDDDKTRRRLSNPLARFAPERDDLWLRIVSDGDDGPVSLEAAEPFAREHDTPVRDGIEASLRAWIDDLVLVVPPTNGSTTSTKLSWTTADLARAVGRRADDKTVIRALQRLADAGVLYRNGDKRWHAAPRLFGDEETTA